MVSHLKIELSADTLPPTGLRLPQAAFRGLVPGRSVHRLNGSCQWDEGGLR
jgi:hypothetical protein